MITNFLCVCLVIMPWVFIPDTRITNQFRIPQMAVMDFIFMGLIAMCLYKGTKITYRNRYLGLFIGYLFFRIFLWVFWPLAFQIPIQMFVMFPTLNILIGAFATVLMISMVDIDYVKIAKALCISGTAVAVFGLLQYVGFDPLKQIAKYHCDNVMSACLDNPNLVGNYLALISPLFLYLKGRYWIGYILAGLCVFFSKSHSAYACFGIATYMSLFLHYRKSTYGRFFVLMIPVAVLSFMLFQPLDKILRTDTGFDGRLYCWQKCIPLIKNNVLFGSGLGAFDVIKPETLGAAGVGNVMWHEAHCDYLQYLIEIGLIGISLFFGLIYNTIRKFDYISDMSVAYFVMFITFLIMMVPSFPVEVPSLAILGLVSYWAVESKNGGSHD